MMKTTQLLAQRQKDARSCRPAVIACLGDSVTHGCFELIDLPDGRFETTYRPQEGYPARLQLRLNALWPKAAPCVLDAGISGDSAAGGLARLDRDVLSVHPDLVIVNFGLNDVCQPDTEKALAAYTKTMRAIFEKVLASGAECMLLTPNRMCSYVQPFITRQDLRDMAARCATLQTGGALTRFVDAAKAEALSLDIPVADTYALWQSLDRCGVDTTALLINGINHPCAEMHNAFARAIMGQLLA